MDRSLHLRRSLAAVGVTAIMLVASAQSASAHVPVEPVSPEDGEVLVSAPAAIRLFAEEPVSADSRNVQLLDSRGAVVASRVATTARDGGSAITVRPIRGLGDGYYAVRWSLRGDDGHEVPGASAFGVATPRVPGAAGPLFLTPAGLAARVSTDKPGRVRITIRGFTGSGHVELTNSTLKAPLSWEWDRRNGALVAQGIIPWPGQWRLDTIFLSGPSAGREYTGTITIRP